MQHPIVEHTKISIPHQEKPNAMNKAMQQFQNDMLKQKYKIQGRK